MFKVASEVVIAVASGIWWIINKFFPFLIKKYGAGAVKLVIQKSISVLVIGVTISFYGAVIIFISETYTRFKFLIEMFNNPIGLGGLSGQSAEYFSCFLNLLRASGISDGLESAFSFAMSVFVFFFLHSLYKITRKSLVIISNEVQSQLKLI